MMIAVNETRPSGEISPISPLNRNSMEFETNSASFQVQVEKVPVIQTEDLDKIGGEIQN